MKVRKIIMNNKKLMKVLMMIYIGLIFIYPFLLGRNVSDINGNLPFFEKLVQNTNLIPFNYNFDINLNIIVKNIVFKILMFVPLGIYLKKEVSFKQGICVLIAIILVKEIFHLVTFVGYFDINDFILYVIGYFIGWGLFKVDTAKLLR